MLKLQSDFINLVFIMKKDRRRKKENINDKKAFDKLVNESIDKYGHTARFPVWNGNVYALDNNSCSKIVPIKQSSRYQEFKELLDYAEYCLTNQLDGSWLYSFKLNKWLCVRLSFGERLEIANFDFTSVENVSLNTPLTPVYPINDKDLIYRL